MRGMKLAAVAGGLLVAACGGAGAPETGTGADDANAMMVSNAVVMSDEIGADPAANAGAAAPANGAE